MTIAMLINLALSVGIFLAGYHLGREQERKARATGQEGRKHEGRG